MPPERKQQQEQGLDLFRSSAWQDWVEVASRLDGPGDHDNCMWLEKTMGISWNIPLSHWTLGFRTGVLADQ